MLLLTPTFADAAFEKISLYGSFKELLRYRNHDTVNTALSSIKTQVTYARHTAMLTFGKKLRDGCLAAQSFFFRKSITSLPFHG